MSSPGATPAQAMPDQLATQGPPVHGLPNETLSWIFHLAIHTVEVREPSQLLCEYKARIICQYLYAFVGVCSRWRLVALSDSDLWSLVPIVEYPSGRHTFPIAGLSLNHAVDHRLRLAIFLNSGWPQIRKFMVNRWAQHSLRFEAVSIHIGSGGCPFHYLTILTGLGCETGNPVTLKELNLCQIAFYDGKSSRREGIDDDTRVRNAMNTREAGYKTLLESLQVLRICGSELSFRSLSFSMLTEIRLQDMVIGGNSAFWPFLCALAPSSQLRKLEIISVFTTSWLGHVPHELADEPSISFPNLEHLYLEDLTRDSLYIILKSITPGPQVVTLNWTNRCEAVSGEVRGAQELSSCKVDVLMIRREPGVSFSDVKLRALLQAMPTITTLYLDSVYLDSEVLRALIPLGQINEQPTHNSTGETSQEPSHDIYMFPDLENLFISRSHCHDLSALRDLSIVASKHPLQELGIGIGTDCDCLRLNFPPSGGDPEGPPQYSQTEIDAEMERVWSSLAGSVPRLTRLSGDASGMPPHLGFESRIWQLC